MARGPWGDAGGNGGDRRVPVWHVLEAEQGWQLLLANGQHVKNVPGRKTDVADAIWLAQLLECGLLRGSFVPPCAIQQLRDLTRYRKKLIEERTRETQRVQKLLEDAGIKLDSVVSDVLGKSARAMLDALIGGERDPVVLAELARTRMRRRSLSCGWRWRADSTTIMH